MEPAPVMEYTASLNTLVGGADCCMPEEARVNINEPSAIRQIPKSCFSRNGLAESPTPLESDGDAPGWAAALRLPAEAQHQSESSIDEGILSFHEFNGAPSTCGADTRELVHHLAVHELASLASIRMPHPRENSSQPYREAHSPILSESKRSALDVVPSDACMQSSTRGCVEQLRQDEHSSAESSPILGRRESVRTIPETQARKIRRTIVVLSDSDEAESGAATASKVAAPLTKAEALFDHLAAKSTDGQIATLSQHVQRPTPQGHFKRPADAGPSTVAIADFVDTLTPIEKHTRIGFFDDECLPDDVLAAAEIPSCSEVNVYSYAYSSSGEESDANSNGILKNAMRDSTASIRVPNLKKLLVPLDPMRKWTLPPAKLASKKFKLCADVESTLLPVPEIIPPPLPTSGLVNDGTKFIFPKHSTDIQLGRSIFDHLLSVDYSVKDWLAKHGRLNSAPPPSTLYGLSKMCSAGEAEERTMQSDFSDDSEERKGWELHNEHELNDVTIYAEDVSCLSEGQVQQAIP